MREALEKVAAFQRAFFIKTGHWPSDTGQGFIPDNDTAQLRDRLHDEEISELSSILVGIDEDTSEAHLLKEICDVLVVVYGTAVTYFDPEVVEEAFNRVHENNMMKIDTGTIVNGKLVKIKNHPKVDLRDLTGEVECTTCMDDPEVCAYVPGLRHCAAAQEEDELYEPCLVCHDDPKECEGATICPWASSHYEQDL